MALGNIFKKQEQAKKVSKKAVSAKPKKKKQAYKADVFKILKEPHITEKATELSEAGQYVFKVWPGVNKIQIRKAVEQIYGVGVRGVRVINIPSKKRRLGKTEGKKKGYKKAIVSVKKGQKIEILPK